MATKRKVSGKEALRRVLAKRGEPMRIKELVPAALRLATGMKGRTPEATLSAMLAVENKKPDGLFVRTAPGVYGLRDAKAKPDKPRLRQRRRAEPAKKPAAAKAEA